MENQARTVPPRKYNPGFLTDDDLANSFCVRTNEFDSIIEVLRECTGRSNPHQLVIGPRGSGKTSLLLRVAIEVRRDAELSSCFFPIVFAEESYEVATAGEFWLECLSRLTIQAPNREGEPDLHRSHEDLRTVRDDRTLAERCLGALMDFSDREGKRLVLVVENLNMMFKDMMDRETGWRLRKILQTEPRIVLLASATSRFDEIDNPDQALYDLFRVSTLRPLDTSECAELWETVSGKCRPPETIRSLEILTGGSPRLLAIVARFGSEMSFRELMTDLLDLVDDHTEYFKSHLEALPAQERRVYLALADLWKPATTREIADRARLETSKCSAQLKRLVDRGVAQVAGGTARRKQYYLTERLYNIYYLLRRSRGPDSLVEALVCFMESFYSPHEQRDIFTRLARETGNFDEEMESIPQITLARMIQMPALSRHRHKVMAARTLFNDAIALENQDRTKEALAAYDAVVIRYGATHAPDIQVTIARSLVNKGAVLHELDRPEEALAVFDEVLSRFEQSKSPALLDSVAGTLVNKGTTLFRLDRMDEALVVYNEVVSRFGVSGAPALLKPVGNALINKGVALHELNRSEEALAAYDEVVSRLGKNDFPVLLELVAQSLVNKGVTLNGLNRLEHALTTYDEVVSRFGKSDAPALLDPVGQALINKGIALHAAHRSEEALATCDEVVSRLGVSDAPTPLKAIAQALLVKATVLLKLNRSDQALAAYDEIVRRFGTSDSRVLLDQVAIALFNKGNELRRVKRSEEALAAYDNIVRRFGEFGTPPFIEQVAKALINKSVALVDLGRPDEALAMCDEVVSLIGENGTVVLLEPVVRALVFKAHELGKLNRNEEAISVYDDVLSRVKKNESQEFNARMQFTLVEKAGLELKIGRYEAATTTIDRLFDPHLKISPENRSRGHLIRASATLALGDIAACERDVQRSLDLLPEIGILPKRYVGELMPFCVDFGLARMSEVIQASQAAHLLLPLTTALELELGTEPRVAVEIMEVAQDIRDDLTKLVKGETSSSSGK
ncbi:tetratricopeptide repeat protein [Candidatus Rariloculus sp.]|uniref:tetratricopeptide repeat protein n=1 Tax=Candidatus Rariloculus sp. TaxID=3101265 RepID=UPI003D0BA114